MTKDKPKPGLRRLYPVKPAVISFAGLDEEDMKVASEFGRYIWLDCPIAMFDEIKTWRRLTTKRKESLRSMAKAFDLIVETIVEHLMTTAAEKMLEEIKGDKEVISDLPEINLSPGDFLPVAFILPDFKNRGILRELFLMVSLPEILALFMDDKDPLPVIKIESLLRVKLDELAKIHHHQTMC